MKYLGFIYVFFICLLNVVFSQDNRKREICNEIDSIELTNETVKKAAKTFLKCIDKVPQKNEVIMMCVSNLSDTMHIEMIEATSGKYMLLVSLSLGHFRKSQFIGKTVVRNRNIYVYCLKETIQYSFYKKRGKCKIDSAISWIATPKVYRVEDIYKPGLHVDPWHIVFETIGNKLYRVDIEEVEWWIIEDTKPEDRYKFPPAKRRYYTLKEFKRNCSHKSNDNDKVL